MGRIVEVDEEGVLSLPADVLERVSPHERYIVSVRGAEIVLTPLDSPAPFWAIASGDERAVELARWAESHGDGPGLPDDALRREQMYD